MKKRTVWILVLGMTAVSLAETGFDLELLEERGSRFFDIARAMVPPDGGFFQEAAGPLLGTVRMSLAGSFLGSLLGLLGAVLGSRRTDPHPWIRVPFLCFIQLLRTVPALILALLCTFLVGLGTLAGTLALTFSTFGVMTRLGYEDMENLDWKTARALEASGCGRGKAFCRAILPRMLPGYLNNALYLWEANVRQAAILGYVGAGGIGLLLNQQLAWRAYSRVGSILVLLYGAVLASESLSEALGKVLNGQWRLQSWMKKGLVVLGIVLFLGSLGTLEPAGRGGLGAARAMIRGLLTPDLSLLFSLEKDGVPWLLGETFAMAFLGTLGGGMAAGFLAFFSSFRFLTLGAALVPRLVLLGIRTVPVFVYGLMWLRVTGPGPFAGTLTLWVCSIGLLAKRFQIGLDSGDRQPFDACRAMGTGWADAFRWTILPQLKKSTATALLYRLDVNLWEASILGLVGAGGIGTPLILALQQYKWQEAGAFLWGLAVLVLAVEWGSERGRR